MKKTFLALFLAGMFLASFAKETCLMYPACFQNNVFNICENFPGMMGMYPINHPESRKGILHLQIPAFLKYRYSAFSNNKKLDHAVEKSIVKDGIAYTQIDITLSKRFLAVWNQYKKEDAFPFYLKEMIVLDAKKGSAGKKGHIYWSLTTDRGKGKEYKITVNVLPAVKMPEVPAKSFTTGFSSIESFTGEMDSYVKDVCNFIKGLTSAESYSNLDYDSKIPDKQFASSKSSGSVCFFPNFRPDPVEKEIRLGKLDHKYPTIKNHHNYRGLALSYMIDDPEGFFAKYLKDGILRFKKNAPYAKYLRWDYEPLASQYSQYDLEVFCRKYLKLDKQLSYAQIQKQYARKWSDFMYSQSEKLVKKYSEAVRKYWPEVTLVMVSSFMDRNHPENRYRSIYTPLDMREAEKYFDIHAPMIYWQGTDFYDDVELNLRFLKKPFMPWIDPSEHSKIFYSRYTPSGVKQNILACAALGAKGIIFYPVSNLDGAYFPMIAEAFDQIAGAENILDGKNITKNCKVAAANVIKRTLVDANNKSVQVVMPQYDNKIRYCIRKKGEKYAVALFNYNKDTVYLRLTVPGFTNGGLVKVAGKDALLLTKLPEQSVLEKELQKEIEKAGEYKDFEQVKHGGSLVAWRALDGEAFPALMSGRCTFMVDTKMAAPRAWTCPFPTWDPLLNPRKERGYLGRIYLMDNTNPLPLEFTLKKFLINDNKPAMLLEHIQKPFGGFQEMENRFEGLQITSRWTLDYNGKKVVLKITVKNNNQKKKSIPVILKIQSFPRIGVKFGPQFAPGILTVDGRKVTNEVESNFILTKEGKKSGMSNPRIPEYKWNDPGKVTIFCTPADRREQLVLCPDEKTSAFYTWCRGKDMTAEFLTEEVLLPYGKSISYSYTFEYSLDKVRK